MAEIRCRWFESVYTLDRQTVLVQYNLNSNQTIQSSSHVPRFCGTDFFGQQQQQPLLLYGRRIRITRQEGKSHPTPPSHNSVKYSCREGGIERDSRATTPTITLFIFWLVQLKKKMDKKIKRKIKTAMLLKKKNGKLATDNRTENTIKIIRKWRIRRRRWCICVRRCSHREPVIIIRVWY